MAVVGWELSPSFLTSKQRKIEQFGRRAKILGFRGDRPVSGDGDGTGILGELSARAHERFVSGRAAVGLDEHRALDTGDEHQPIDADQCGRGGVRVGDAGGEF